MTDEAENPMVDNGATRTVHEEHEVTRMSDRRLLTEEEAARYLGVSRGFLRISRMDGNRRKRTPAPPFVKIGTRGIRYDLIDLDEWIDAHKVQLKSVASV